MLSGALDLLHTPARTLPSHKATNIRPSSYRRESHRLFHADGRAKQKTPASLTFCWLGHISTKLSSPTDQTLPWSSISLGRWELDCYSHLNQKCPILTPFPVPSHLSELRLLTFESCIEEVGKKKIRKSTWVKDKKYPKLAKLGVESKVNWLWLKNGPGRGKE